MQFKLWSFIIWQPNAVDFNEYTVVISSIFIISSSDLFACLVFNILCGVYCNYYCIQQILYGYFSCFSLRSHNGLYIISWPPLKVHYFPCTHDICHFSFNDGILFCGNFFLHISPLLLIIMMIIIIVLLPSDVITNKTHLCGHYYHELYFRNLFFICIFRFSRAVITVWIENQMKLSKHL